MAAVQGFMGEPHPGTEGGFGDALTARELLELLAGGLDNATIATRLGLRTKTVRNHITHIFEKIDVRTRAEAIVKAREAGLGTDVSTSGRPPGTRVPNC